MSVAVENAIVSLYCASFPLGAFLGATISGITRSTANQSTLFDHIKLMMAHQQNLLIQSILNLRNRG